MGFVVTSIFKVVDPLTRLAPADENAGGSPPSPPRGRGNEFTSGVARSRILTSSAALRILCTSIICRGKIKSRRRKQTALTSALPATSSTAQRREMTAWGCGYKENSTSKVLRSCSCQTQNSGSNPAARKCPSLVNALDIPMRRMIVNETWSTMPALSAAPRSKASQAICQSSMVGTIR